MGRQAYRRGKRKTLGTVEETATYIRGQPKLFTVQEGKWEWLPYAGIDEGFPDQVGHKGCPRQNTRLGVAGNRDKKVEMRPCERGVGRRQQTENRRWDRFTPLLHGTGGTRSLGAY